VSGISAALRSRLKRLESRRPTAESRVEVRVGTVKRLPPEYEGERHLVVARQLTTEYGGQRFEFEEAPGPDPDVQSGSRAGHGLMINVILVPSPRSYPEAVSI
jgi:hypothetical protein